jgi:mycofactocin system creatininase family protein
VIGGADLATGRWPALPERPTVLVPFGSTEQHGPHLPLDTDGRIAVATTHALAASVLAARRVAGESSPRAPELLVAPLLAYGSSGEHQDFPGTVSMGTDALVVVTVELVRSLSVWAGRVVIVNGHGGNVDALSRAVPQLRDEQHDVAWVSVGPAGADPHAGFAETSLLLHLAPDLVDVAAASVGATEPLAELLPRLRAKGVRAVSPSGVLGDPTGASASEGERLFTRMVSDLHMLLQSGRADRDGMLRLPEEVER